MIQALRVRGAAFLLLTSLVGRLPAAMSSLAIVRLIRDHGGTFERASVLTAVFVVAATFGQPALSRLIDRSGQARLVLLGSSAVATVALVALVALEGTKSLPLEFLCVAVAGFATPPLESCLRSLWSVLMAPGPQLHAAFSLDAAAQELVFIAGPLITGFGILLFGGAGNILLMAGLGLFGACAFATSRRLQAGKPKLSEIGFRRSSPLENPPFRRLTFVLLAAGFPVGVLTISATGFAELHGVVAVSSWALAANAAGALVSAVLISRRPSRRPPEFMVRHAATCMAVFFLPTAWVSAPIALWLTFAFVSGAALPLLLTQAFAQTTLLADASQINEANAWIVSAFTIGLAGGTILAGYLVAALPAGRGIFVAVLVGSAVTGVGSLTASPRALVARPISD